LYGYIRIFAIGNRYISSKLVMSDFARSFMNRHGWVEGKGLGANEDGMAEPIKVKIKNDLTGVGYNHAKQFTNFWWDDAFKNASSNILVENNSNEVKITSNKKEKKSRTVKAAHLSYKNFVQNGVMVDGVVERTSDSSTSEDEDETCSNLTDDQLLKACGGRTAHKGARHGIKQAGKLARLAQCEQDYLTKYSGNLSQICNDYLVETKVKRKRKLKKSKSSTKLSKLNVNFNKVDL